MTKSEKCSLCQTQCTVVPQEDKIYGRVYLFECPVCGDYLITLRAHDVPSFIQTRKEKLYIIRGITRNYCELNDSPFIITDKMVLDNPEFEAKILSQEPKTVLDKAELLLQYINRKSKYPGDIVPINPSKDYPVCFCKKPEELIFYIKSLNEIGYVQVNGSSDDYSLLLTAEGWQRVESMVKPNIESRQAFVAMWFDKSMDAIFTNGIKSIEKEVGFTMFRVDETHFIDEKICDKIIAEIKKSRFLIADVTEHRQAVYFEAGYAMGMGIPVIWTCKDEKKYTDNCCFDTRQYPHIFWKDAGDLQNQLKEKILATIGKA